MRPLREALIAASMLVATNLNLVEVVINDGEFMEAFKDFLTQERGNLNAYINKI